MLCGIGSLGLVEKRVHPVSWPNSSVTLLVSNAPLKKWRFLSGLDIWFLPFKIQGGIYFALLFSGGLKKCRYKIRGALFIISDFSGGLFSDQK